MKLAEVNWDPTIRQLRQFGAICPLALPSLGWLWGGDIRIISLLAIVGLLIAVGGLAWPGALASTLASWGHSCENDWFFVLFLLVSLKLFACS